MTVPAPRHLSRRQFLDVLGAGAGAAGIGALLAGCAPSEPEESAPAASAGGDPSGSASPAPSSLAPATFGFAAWSLNEEAQAPTVQGLLDDWSSETGDTIETVSYPYAEYLNQLTLQVRGGQFTGAAQLDINWLNAIAQLGSLRDLSDYAAQAPYTEAALASGQLEGRQLGLPWTTGAIGIIANSQILETAGVGTTFDTVEDFEAALAEIKAAVPDVVPFGGMTAVDQLKDILGWMLTFGSPVVDGDEVTLGDEASVEAVAFWKRLYDAELIPPALNRFDARALFAQGRLAMYEDAIVGRGAVRGQAPEGFTDLLVPVAKPAPAGGTPTSLLWGHLIVVVEGEGSENAAAMAAAVTGDPETGVAYFEALGLPPTTEPALADPAVTADTYTADFTERITSTAVASPLLPFVASAQMETVIAEQVQRVLVGEASPQEAMDAAREGVQALV